MKIKDLNPTSSHCKIYNLNRVMEPVLPRGVKQAMDASGNPKLDKFGIYI